MSKIEWTEQTWNPIIGCSKVSAGCKNCYAETMAKRLKAMGTRGYGAVAGDDGHWNGKIKLIESVLEQPLKRKIPTTYFVNSMSDLFHENVLLDDIFKIYSIMAECPQHTFQILTKRPEIMVACLCDIDPLPNVWHGTLVENQETADERIPELLKVPSAVRFLSCEPLLGAVNFVSHFNREAAPHMNFHYVPTIDWVICGGESGHKARPMHPAWARSLRDQCVATDVPFFFKQWGEWLPAFEYQYADVKDDYENSKYDSCVWDTEKNSWTDTAGSWDDHENWYIANNYLEPEQQMFCVGKKQAGNKLEGEVWQQMPKVKG